MNIWRDINPSRVTSNDFVACVEIEKGSKNKYELDKETGMIILDRVLYTSTHYPMNYGFIPLTYAGDDDPLDVFIFCSEPIDKLSLVRCYPIGVVKMIDIDAMDEKIVAIPFKDPAYNCYQDISELPRHIIEELRHFLQVYKQLEKKDVEVLEIHGRLEALITINEALQRYQEKFKK